MINLRRLEKESGVNPSLEKEDGVLGLSSGQKQNKKAGILCSMLLPVATLALGFSLQVEERKDVYVSGRVHSTKYKCFCLS